MTTRVLVLGNSNDLDDGGDGHATVMWRVAAGLEQYVHDSVDVRHVVAFPNAGLARYAEKIVDEFDPEIVLLHCSGVAVGPVTLNARILHLLGRRRHARYQRLLVAVRRRIGLGPTEAAPPGAKLGLLKALYFGVRDGLLRLGPGDTFMSVEEATAAYAALIKLLAAREDLVFVVRGAPPKAVNERIPRLQAGAEARTAALDAALAAECRQRRVGYTSGMPLWPVLRSHLLPDRLHWDAEGHAMLAEQELHLLSGYFPDKR